MWGAHNPQPSRLPFAFALSRLGSLGSTGRGAYLINACRAVIKIRWPRKVAGIYVAAGRGCGVGPNAEQHLLLIAYLGADVTSIARPQNQMWRLRRRTPAAHTDEHEPTLSQFVMPGTCPGTLWGREAS